MNYEEDNRIPPAEDYEDEVIDPKNPPRAFRDDELDLKVDKDTLQILLER